MRKGFVGTLSVTLAAALVGTPLVGQTPNEDEAAALAVVESLFDGMREHDTDAMAALFTDGARLVSAGEDRDGNPRLSIDEISGWLESVKGSEAFLDERIWDPAVEVSDRLATVWVKYALYVNDDFVHCGVDAFSLFQADDGWRIFQVVDTRRREDCWFPSA